MKILFVASECTPIAKVGGLGDVIGSLPKALEKRGVHTKIILPFYELIQQKIWKPKLVLELNKETKIYKTKLPRSDVEVFLVYNKQYLSTGPVYLEKTAFVNKSKEIERFLFFSRTVYQLLKHPKFWKPDIVHCHDWHTGALVSSIKHQVSRNKSGTVFTIHNLANKGKIGGGTLIGEGIINADKVSTVSETYAKEILTKEYGEGLENLLKKRKKDLIGILNGIDYEFWPRPKNILDKKTDHKNPKFGLVARLTDQKGINLVLPLVPNLIEQEGAQFYFLGRGKEEYEKTLISLAKKYPGKVKVKIGFDEKLAHKIYEQSDFFLMPSLFEPSGLGQMISMNYGTIPIVRATGGLKDSVQHLKTGFVFEKPTSKALFSAIKLALQYFKNPIKIAKIRKNCLAEDFSWTKSAKKYKQLYENLESRS